MDFKTDFKPLTVDPDKIYDYSFSIIAEEMGNHDFSEDEWKIVRRVIHASADFELGRSVIIHPNAIQAGVEAIRKGRHVIADVQMIESGTGKKRFQKHGGDVHCYISDPDVMVEAKRLNTTRAIISMQKAVKENEGGIYAIGNAPTALLELIRLIKEGIAKPDLIIGMPVGFVSAAESKEELAKITEVPFITNIGRKGGSTVTVAALNAISLLADS
ncbi:MULTISPECIES: precorrin-8X methylmutase [Bacillaceae]|jgi:precorrin-8X/cobalt-precorrin-8 methylmutase|uniref:Cobalt-precorrin-8 methylmutase n=3 Tax=Peribacillus TaxID=2675229 RepID=A0A9W4L4F7_9BACI|nr:MULTISPECIES: precorrin-8X methylmutase [Bacillaceae]KOR78640.1 precorrin-8X methylmutase [Bacillus sp. FJAT-21352]KOR83232.1 precorrin-8X methylmutase [Bacillus sp. FJAT-22058]KRF59650.1 precorrin-8X methylmutase [Bacillus sp. Soil745]MBD8137526.1 precorrin-8X methylmutase [Bacillus sp. CFBP 13597]MBL3640849.1 precorrin-8X methylmutase [Bacillus sp. RHFB]MBT2604392.1 precorrin-8X methylmutase [Bacillus sp. ISL-53]MBT2674006.1 precorrin-8X methylmutase [Streptomyces sp. ISL-14]MCD1160901